jgi:hypothetical protein
MLLPNGRVSAMASSAWALMAMRIMDRDAPLLARIGSRLAHLGKPSEQPPTTLGSNLQLRR